MKNVKKFCIRNKGITFISIVSFLVVISYIITSDCPEIFTGADRWYKLASDFGLGFIISAIFYIFQVFIPGLADEKKAAKLIENDISKLLTYLDEHIWLIDNLISFEVDTVKIKNDAVFYKYSNYATYFNMQNDLQIDLQVIKKRCDKITTNYYFNKSDIDFIDCFLKIPGSQYITCLKILIDAYGDEVRIPEFKKEFFNFKNNFNELKKYNNFNKRNFIILNTDEINFVTGIMSSYPDGINKTPDKPRFYVGLPNITE